MNFEKFKSYLQVIRVNNCLMSFITVFLTIKILDANYSTFSAMIAGLIYFFVFASGNVINDVFDIEIDRINKPFRPIPSGKISIIEGKVIYTVAVILSYLLALSFGLSEFCFILFLNILIYFYSYAGKKIIFFSNVLVAYFVASTFLFAGMVSENFQFIIIPFIIAFGINIIREIIKDAEDAKGDMKNGVKTIYTYKGKKFMLIICYSIVSLLVLALVTEMVLEIFKIEFFIISLLFIMYPIVMYLKIVDEHFTIDKLGFVSSRLKIIMLFGLFALFMGV